MEKVTETVSSESSAEATAVYEFLWQKSEQLQPITLQNQTIETMHLPELGLSEIVMFTNTLRFLVRTQCERNLRPIFLF